MNRCVRRILLLFLGGLATTTLIAQPIDSLRARIVELRSEIARTEAALTNAEQESQRRLIAAAGGITRLAYRNGTCTDKPGGSNVVGRVAARDSVRIVGRSNSFLVAICGGATSYVHHTVFQLERTEIEQLPEMLTDEQKAARSKEQQEAEARQRQREAYAETLLSARQNGLPLLITGFRADVNSAGGAEPILHFIPTARKEIKYVRVSALAYNSVGDVVTSTIGGTREGRLTLTGPLQGDLLETYASWEPVWYNHSIRCLRITRLEVDYIDGTRSIYVRDLPKLYGEGFTNDCSLEAQRQ